MSDKEATSFVIKPSKEPNEGRLVRIGEAKTYPGEGNRLARRKARAMRRKRKGR
jgi:hypothetical protein